MCPRFSAKVRSTRLIASSGIVLFLLIFSMPAWAAFVCYDEKFYPSVAKLEKTGASVRVLLGGKFFQAAQSYPRERLALKYSERGGWERDKPFPCIEGAGCFPKEHRGKPSVPPITLSQEEAVALVPRLQGAIAIAQDASAWTEHNGVIWFGISFYAGEGTDGVGGIGRYDPRTGQTVIRRPKVLLESSINHIVHDGEWLWLGTTGYYECDGEPPDHGLIRYRWETDQIETFEGTDSGPCGFVVHDLFLEQHSLWVATDLGLSRLDRRSKTWEHYVPDPTASPPMKSTSCATLYSDLLKTLPRTFDPEYDVTFYSQLFDPLKRFRPRFLKTYVAAMPPADWQCDELKFLAGGAQDFQTLKADLLSVRPVGSPHFRCVLEGFGAKKSRDPEWRDLLLSSFMKPGEKTEYRDEVVLRLLQGFPGDSKVGEALAQRLKTAFNPWQEAELLPTMLGERSIPHLIQALDRFQDLKRQDHIVDAIIKALVQATRLVISPNGSVSSISSKAEQGRYRVSDKARPLVVAQWKKWWEIHKAEYGVEPVQKESIAPGKVAGVAAVRIEPKLTLSSPSSALPLGTISTLTATVTNVAEPSNPPLRDFSVSFRVVKGAHVGIVTPIRGVTDAKGSFTFSYSGTKSGTDRIEVSHDGEDIFMEGGYVEVAWDGPDLVVPLFIPPVLQSGGGKTMFVTDWTQNSGSFPSAPSTTRYLLSPTNPPDPARARVIGERAIPALDPGERSAVKELRFTLPDDLPAGVYYLAACADSDGKVLESNEQNNCSFSRLPGQVTIIAPMIPATKEPR